MGIASARRYRSSRLLAKRAEIPASVMEFGFNWTTRGYANSRTGQLAVAAADSNS